MVWPMPGRSPMKNTLPMCTSAGFAISKSARGPETITASVPFLAPPMPPLTGESICTIFFFANAAAIFVATREPVVDRSMKRLTRFPWMTPPSPVATFSEICSEGRLAITVSTRSATSAGDDASRAPIATKGATASLRVS